MAHISVHSFIRVSLCGLKSRVLLLARNLVAYKIGLGVCLFVPQMSPKTKRCEINFLL